MALILAGQVGPMDPADPQASFQGRVFLGDDGLVAAVQPTAQPRPAGFANTPEIDVGNSYIYPGLIDLHSHIGYATLPLWTEPTQETPFLHHNRWPDADSYRPDVIWPSYLVAVGAPEALLVYAQVRALAGGTTAIQGWPSRNRNPVNRLVRNIDDEDLGTGNKTLFRTSTLTLDNDELLNRADHLDDGEGFIYHCGEGQAKSIVTSEFDDLALTNCLRDKLVAIHLTALDEEGFRRWDERARLANDNGPGAVVWSPFSNLWLYGQTTDVLAAAGHNVTVCLGSDWGPSGTKNLLGELKTARLWSDHAALGMSAFELATMVTAAPGDILARCWPTQAGRLVPGAVADVAVMASRDPDPWENLIVAREEDVRLVVVGGEARYGTKALMEACGATRTTSVGIGGGHVRRITLLDPVDTTSRWYWSRVIDQIDAVRADPAGAMDAGLRAMSAIAGKARADMTFGDPLVLELDMPGRTGVRAGPPPDPASVTVPRAPSLRHDRNWRASIKNRGFHDGILDDLDRFYT